MKKIVLSLILAGFANPVFAGPPPALPAVNCTNAYGKYLLFLVQGTQASKPNQTVVRSYIDSNRQQANPARVTYQAPATFSDRHTFKLQFLTQNGNPTRSGLILEFPTDQGGDITGAYINSRGEVSELTCQPNRAVKANPAVSIGNRQ